jgi:oxalate decarboxylase
MSEQFWFNLAEQDPPVIQVPGGTIAEANVNTFPALQGISAYLLTLDPGGVRIPHWHPDAAEMQYLISGSQVQVGLISTASKENGPGTDVSYTLQEPGWVGYIPQGWFHYIQNTGTEPAQMLILFNNQAPNDLDVSWALGIGGQAGMQVMEQVFRIPLGSADLQKIWNAPGTPGGTTPSSAFAYNLAGQSPPAISIPGGGTVQETKIDHLDGIDLFLLTLEPGAVRIPHWHPDAVEVQYLLSGQVNVGLMSTANGTAAGTDCSFQLDQPGMLGFVPQGWLHFIQNNGPQQAQVLIGFNSASPDNVDLSWAFGTGGADGANVLQEVFGVSWADADFQQIWIAPPPPTR